jgi:hypothetical protein
MCSYLTCSNRLCYPDAPYNCILQVPLEDEKRKHSNLAHGIAHLRILVTATEFEGKVKEIQAILGFPPLTESSQTLERTWELESPNEDKDIHKKYRSTRLVLAAANENDLEEAEFVKKNGTGLFEVGFAVATGGGSTHDRTPYARITWHVDA